MNDDKLYKSFRNFLQKKSWPSHFPEWINAWPFTNTYTKTSDPPPTSSKTKITAPFTMLVNSTWKTVGVSFLFLNWTRTTLLFLNLLRDEPVLWEVWTQWTWDQLKVSWLSVAALNYSRHVHFCYIKACLTWQLVLNYKWNFLCLRIKPTDPRWNNCVDSFCWLLRKCNITGWPANQNR